MTWKKQKYLMARKKNDIKRKKKLERRKRKTNDVFRASIIKLSALSEKY
jgi:hypothetical protein